MMDVLTVLSNKAAISHMWLLKIKMNFNLCIKALLFFIPVDR